MIDRTRRTALAACALTLGFAACRDTTAYEGVRVVVPPSRAAMHAGDTLKLTIVVENTGPREEWVDMYCPQVSVSTSGGKSVIPNGICLAIADSHRLLPNEAFTFVSTWRGETEFHQGEWTYAPPGEYQIAAALPTSVGFVSSAPVKLTIVQ
jgi:hypothetical protein